MDQTVPGIVDEPVTVLVLGQVAVVVIGGGCRATYRSDLVLPVRAAGLGRAVGRYRIPVSHRIIIPALGIGWGKEIGQPIGRDNYGKPWGSAPRLGSPERNPSGSDRSTEAFGSCHEL